MKKKTQEKIKRYVIFIMGLFVNSLGVSFVTKANLGTSPISSIPYVLSLNFPMTLGQFTIYFSILLILLQVAILGIGVYMEVLANVIMLPGESFVRAIVSRWATEFGFTKICFDVSMSVIAVIVSFIFAGTLNGIREGTIIAALLVGYIARTIGKKMDFLSAKV